MAAYSGGTLERPAFQRLLADVSAGKVDVVVVYKVDRLTRSLSDFAKIVEVFDKNGVSFVSVTQQFNTTSSMGRLTLNILLSFAQFEREVTGERIRDKIAASKKKGMWMGGQPPLGYDVKDRKLVVNEQEAETVRHIFRRYLELKSVRLLKADLDEQGIVSKARKAADGSAYGSKPLARGALYLMLQNRVYRGETVHKDKSYPGEHDAIVDERLWNEVQVILVENSVDRNTCGTGHEPEPCPLGIVFDKLGNQIVQRMLTSVAFAIGIMSLTAAQRFDQGRTRGAACPSTGIGNVMSRRLRGQLATQMPFATISFNITPLIRRYKNALFERATSLFDRWRTMSAHASVHLCVQLQCVSRSIRSYRYHFDRSLVCKWLDGTISESCPLEHTDPIRQLMTLSIPASLRRARQRTEDRS